MKIAKGNEKSMKITNEYWKGINIINEILICNSMMHSYL